MLRHLNIRFNGDFDLENLPNKYNPVAHQIEMHLCSLRTKVLQALNFKVSLGRRNYSH